MKSHPQNFFVRMPSMARQLWRQSDVGRELNWGQRASGNSRHGVARFGLSLAFREIVEKHSFLEAPTISHRLKEELAMVLPFWKLLEDYAGTEQSPHSCLPSLIGAPSLPLSAKCTRSSQSALLTAPGCISQFQSLPTLPTLSFFFTKNGSLPPMAPL